MRRTNKTVGTGMTKRAIVTFDWDDPADVDAQIQAAIMTFEQTSFDRLSKRIVSHAVQILAQAGLPTEMGDAYAIAGAKSWTRLKQNRRSKRAKRQGLSLSELVLQLGYMSDSPEGYATRLISLIDEARRLRDDGQVDEAMAKAFAVGELIKEAWIKEVWEPDALRGVKLVESARQGHVAVHGTEESKAARRDACLRTYRQSLAEGLSRMAAYEAAAKKHGVGTKTIQRAVKLSRG
jgi:hypothetical protein